MAVRPDPVAPRAVFCADAHVLVCRVKPKGELPVEHRFRLGTGEHDRTGSWTARPEVVRFTADGERLLFAGPHGAHGGQLELWHPGRPKALLQATVPYRVQDAQFSADGDHLFLLAADGAVSVCHPGLVTHVRARLVWHAADAMSLAVSPDGRTLATAGCEGVKLWPVGRLVEVL
jgi:WD40 repeat protein